MSTVERITERVIRNMLRGEALPGSWLRQDDLAAQLGVSKVPVREALQRLVGRGLLEYEPNRGAMIPHLSVQDIQENFRLRSAIEPVLLSEAIEKIGPEQLLDAENKLAHPSPFLTEANWDFHRSLYLSSGWSHALMVTEALRASVAPYKLIHVANVEFAARQEAEQKLILEASKNRDGSLAVDTLNEHLRRSEKALIEYGLASRSL